MVAGDPGRQLSPASEDALTLRAMANWLLRLTQNSFVRPVAILMTGASLAQLLNLLLLPVLTAIFTPADFDVLAVFAGLSIMTYRAASLGLDYALPVAENDEKAANLLVAALMGVASVSVLVGVATALTLPMIPDQGKAAAYDIFLWLVPLSTLLIGATTAFEFWHTRLKRFALISRARLAQVVMGGAVQVSLGLAGAGADGLLIGYLVINCSALLLFTAHFIARDRPLFRGVSRASIRATVREYIIFPKFTAAEILANACSVYLPIVIISAALAGPEAGFLLLALRLTQGPIVTLSQAVSSVYYSRALQSRRDNRLGQDTAAVLRGLIGITTGPFTALAIIAPGLVAAVLGETWRPVGVYISLTLPLTFLLLLSSAILTTMHTHGRNAQVLYLTLFGLVMRVAAVGGAAAFAKAWLIPAYAVSGTAFYALCLAIFMRVNAIRLREIVPRDRIFLASVAGSIAVGLGFNLLLPDA
jgi:O-antigen/teichoic acid export membrane protein